MAPAQYSGLSVITNGDVWSMVSLEGDSESPLVMNRVV